MTTEELKARAESIEHTPEGDYYTLPAGSLTGEEFAEIIMGEVHKLQAAKLNRKDCDRS